jgi:hypothetical protein
VGIGAPFGEGRAGWVLALFPVRRKLSRLAAVLGRLYDATWGRAFAWGYDAFQRRSCAAGMEDKRRHVLGEALGRTLEIGSGTGINLDHYGPGVTELVMSEPDRHMVGRLLFIEHVRSPEPGLARWQDRLHGPWLVFARGCHCNRDTMAAIEGSPLEIERVERGEIPKVPRLVRPMVAGAAQRR